MKHSSKRTDGTVIRHCFVPLSFGESFSIETRSFRLFDMFWICSMTRSHSWKGLYQTTQTIDNEVVLDIFGFVVKSLHNPLVSHCLSDPENRLGWNMEATVLLVILCPCIRLNKTVADRSSSATLQNELILSWDINLAYQNWSINCISFYCIFRKTPIGKLCNQCWSLRRASRTSMLPFDKFYEQSAFVGKNSWRRIIFQCVKHDK